MAFTHGSHTLEVVWSILPAATLVFIAIYQMNAWADAKMRRPKLPNGQVKPPLAEITGRQFEWRIRYAGEDGEVGTADDIQLANDLHLPVNEEIVLSIKSADVLHSFFLPNLRVKQDVVPGMKQFVWFQPTKIGRLRHCVCGAVRLGTLQDARPRDDRVAREIRRLAGAAIWPSRTRRQFTPAPAEAE